MVTGFVWGQNQWPQIVPGIYPPGQPFSQVNPIAFRVLYAGAFAISHPSAVTSITWELTYIGFIINTTTDFAYHAILLGDV